MVWELVLRLRGVSRHHENKRNLDGHDNSSISLVQSAIGPATLCSMTLRSEMMLKKTDSCILNYRTFATRTI